MINKTKKQEINEIMKALIERDFQDLKIDKLNKKKLIKEGLTLQKPPKKIIIDSGKIEGVNNVVDIIKKNINKNIKIIALEGESGAGKSATTQALAKEINGQIFSLGEIFRYLTYRSQKIGNINFDNVLNNLSYKIINGNLKLFDKKLNISDKLYAQLRNKTIEAKFPKISPLAQKSVIKFSQRQIASLKKSFSGIILIEGRSFTLNFLPSDLRIKLSADLLIRAKRRLIQKFKN